VCVCVCVCVCVRVCVRVCVCGYVYVYRLGRRMPYILLGNFLLFLCLGAMFLARTYLYGYTYLALLLAAVVALNVAYTGFTGMHVYR
jgi:hypothetical protein